MQKKFLAVVLCGMMVFGSFAVVYAADEQEREIAISVEAEEGPLDNAKGMLFGLKESGVGSLLEGLLGGAEDGSEGGFSLDADTLKSLVSGMGSKLGIDLSEEDIASLSEMLKNPEALKNTFGGLFTEGGIGAKLLDMISSYSSTIGAVVDSVENGEGGYDMDKILEILENTEEKDGSVVIGGTEISKEEIYAAVTGVLGSFGGSQ